MELIELLEDLNGYDIYSKAKELQEKYNKKPLVFGKSDNADIVEFNARVHDFLEYVEMHRDTITDEIDALLEDKMLGYNYDDIIGVKNYLKEFA